MCSFEGCDRNAIARGMCLMHYKRWRRKNAEQIYDWQKPAKVRFWDNVEKQDSCWLWKGSLTLGYGRLWVGSKNEAKPVSAHRFAYQLLVGDIPEGAEIDHLCRNRACVNPAHLEAVSQRENILRGDGIAAKHARKTHCPKGHPYDEANTMREKNGARRCRACRNDTYREWKSKTVTP